MSDTNKPYKYSFEGKLHIGDKQFSVYFDKATTSQFIATYTQTGSLNIKDLVSSLSSGIAAYIPEGFSLDIKSVVLGINQVKNTDEGTSYPTSANTNNTKTQFLFGFNMALSLSLSNLPIIGKLPQESTVSLKNLQVLVSNNDLDQKTVEQLNNIITQHAPDIATFPVLSNEQSSKALLATILQIPGVKDQTLNLTLGKSTPKSNINGTTISPHPNDNSATNTNTATETTSAQPATPGADTASQGSVKWFPINKKIGPFDFQRVGLKLDTSPAPILNISLDIAASGGGLTIALEGLSIGAQLNPFKINHPTLSGLGVMYANGGLTVAGGLFKADVSVYNADKKPGKQLEFSYDGFALLKYKTLQLSVVGSYAQLKQGGQPSLFLYGVLSQSLGGPPFFFVTGLAAGFGYNRSLTMPSLDQISSFPLVTSAEGSISAVDKATALEMLTGLQPWIPPNIGENFIAIGVKFTSFKMIDSFALLTATFGAQVRIDILGHSTLIAPAPKTGDNSIKPLARVELVYHATFLPEEGVLKIDGKLTDSSYIFDPAAHLTGGFAFYAWFSGAHQGDFVYTLGGYHPKFQIPSHYPKVDRLALNWQVTEELSIKADSYFALCSSALMAGVHLQAIWQSGSIIAWFIAGADFLIAWKPYHYEADVNVTMGVSYSFWFFGTQTISVQIGAHMNLYGPPFSGQAQVSLWIVSFTIHFGADKPALEPITADEFKNSFLPEESKICSLQVTGGLIKQNQTPDNEYDVLINPKEFVLEATSFIPCNAVSGINAIAGPKSFGIAPMNINSGEVTSTQNFTIIDGNNNSYADQLLFSPIYKNLPKALWGTSMTPSLDTATITAVVGYRVTPKQINDEDITLPIEKKNLQYEFIDKAGSYKWITQSYTVGEATIAFATIDKQSAARKQTLQALGLKNQQDYETMNLGNQGFIAKGFYCIK